MNMRGYINLCYIYMITVEKHKYTYSCTCNMDSAILEDLGLSHNEATIYKTLLELGQTKTGAVVKRTGLHRVIIYDALESLIKKGLASYVIKENIKYFQATDPTNLVKFLEEKKTLAEKILPQLKLLQQEKITQNAVIYEGLRGLKSALNNMLEELSPGGTHYVFGSGNMAPAMGPYYDIYQRTKKERHIKTYAVVDTSYRENKDIIKRTHANIRVYPLSTFPTDTWIYNDKVLIVTYTAKPPLAILITSKETAQSYKRLFDGYWKKAKPL